MNVMETYEVTNLLFSVLLAYLVFLLPTAPEQCIP